MIWSQILDSSNDDNVKDNSNKNDHYNKSGDDNGGNDDDDFHRSREFNAEIENMGGDHGGHSVSVKKTGYGKQTNLTSSEWLPKMLSK